MKILVVDDDEDILELSQSLLEEAGYASVTASNGKKALEVMASDPGITVMVSDIRMPEMDGLELAAHCRKLYPNIPIILCSGYVHAADPTKLQDVFMVIVKPVNISEYESAVTSAISKAALASE